MREVKIIQDPSEVKVYATAPIAVQLFPTTPLPKIPPNIPQSAKDKFIIEKIVPPRNPPETQ